MSKSHCHDGNLSQSLLMPMHFAPAQIPPTFGGVLEARCNWADTASTVMEAAAAPDSSATAVVMEEISRADSMSDALFRSCSSESFNVNHNTDGSLKSYRLDLPSSSTISTSNSGGCGEIEPASPVLPLGGADSKAAQKLSSLPEGQQQVQLQQEGSAEVLLSSPGSSGDVSMYSAYDTSGPFGAVSSYSKDSYSKGPGADEQQQQPQLPPLPRPPQQSRGNPLTVASLKQAAAEAAAAGGAGMRHHAQRGPLSVSSSPLSALNSAAGHSMLSPMGTDVSGQLPTRAVSSSTLSFSSLEVSEESCGAMSDEGLGLVAPGSAFGGSEAGSRTDDGQDSMLSAPMGAAGAADAAVLLDEQLYSDPCAYEQLMAVEPELLLLEQQQQLLIQQQAEATIEAVRHSSSSSSYSSVFVSSTAAAAAAADEQQALFDAAADLAELDSQAGVGMVGYLPTEETLPPTALTRFAGLSEIQEVGDEEELFDDIPNTGMHINVQDGVACPCIAHCPTRKPSLPLIDAELSPAPLALHQQLSQTLGRQQREHTTLPARATCFLVSFVCLPVLFVAELSHTLANNWDARHILLSVLLPCELSICRVPQHCCTCSRSG
jgi:hypothetical protein